MDRGGLVIFDLYNLIESQSLDPFPGTADILDQLIERIARKPPTYEG